MATSSCELSQPSTERVPPCTVAPVRVPRGRWPLLRLRLAGALVVGLVGTGLIGTPAYAEPSPLLGDSVRADQYQLRLLGVAGAWTYASGAGVTVAVIDSGVDAHHVDLDGQV